MKAGPMLRGVVVPSLLLFGGWRLFLLSETSAEARLPAAILISVVLVVIWAYACVLQGLERLDANAILVAGLGSLGPILRICLEGPAGLRLRFQEYPTFTTIDLALTLILALVTAPVCFILYNRKRQ